MKLLQTVLAIGLVWISAVLPRTAWGQDELRIVYNAGVAPLKFEDASGNPKGLFPDIWRLWGEKTGKKIRFIKTDTFEQSLELLKSGQADLHAGLFKTKAREKFLAYSQPLLHLEYFVFSHPSIRPVHLLEDTAGLIVGIAKGGFTENFVRSRVPDKRIQVYDTFNSLFMAVQKGEIRVFVATRLSLLYWLKKNGLANIYTHDKNNPLYSQIYYTAALRENSALVSLVDRGLAAISPRERTEMEDHWLVRRTREIPLDFSVMLTDEERSFLSRKQVIRVHNESDWAPFNFNENGVPKGYSIDYMKFLAEKTGLEAQFVNGPDWDQFLEMMKTGDLDVMLNIAETPERQKFLIFTPPYVKMIQMLYSRKDFPEVRGIEDLYGKKIAVPKSFYLNEVLKDHPKVRVVTVKDTTEAVHAVSTGRADVLFDLMPVVNYILNQLQITNLKVGGDIGIVDRRPIPLHMAVSSSQKVLADILVKGMSMISEEDLRTLQHRWLEGGPDRSPTVFLTAKQREWIASHPVIRVSNERDYPPFDFFENGRPSGFSIDYLNLLASHVGLKLVYIQKPWNELLNMGKDKQLDLLTTIFKTPDREAYLQFTPPYKSLVKAIYVAEGVKDIFSIHDFYAKRVVILKGDELSEVLPRLIPKAKFIFRPDYDTILKDLSLGRADATILDTAVANFMLRKMSITNVHASAEADIPGGNRYTAYRLAVRNDWPQLLSILEKAMASVTPEEMGVLENRWLSYMPAGREGAGKIRDLTLAERTWLGRNRDLKLGVDPHWPPYEFIEKNGTYAGVTSDYVKILKENLGLTLTPVTDLSWREMMGAVKAGKIDVVSAMMKTPEREKFLTFCEPHTRLPLVIITRTDAHLVQGIENLKGKIIALVDGYTVEDFLKKDLPDQSFVRMKSLAGALRAVSEGKADATVETIPVMTYYQKKLGLSNLKVAATTPYHYALAFAVRKELSPLAPILNKAMAGISDQERAIIQDKWANPRVTLRVDWTLVWQAVLVVAFVAGIVLFLVGRSNRRLAAEISVRKAAELKIRAMSDASHDAMIMINGKDEVMFWNASAERIFGYTAQEAAGALMHKLFTSEDVRESAEKGLRHFARTGRGPVVGSVIEQTAFRRDGSKFPAEIAVSSFKLDDGWYAVGSVRDITERKTAEQELKTKEKRFRGYFETSLVGMTITHPDKGWIEINERFQEMMGYDREELKTMTWAEITHSDDLEADLRQYGRMLAGEISSYSMDKRFVRKDGSILYTNLAVSCVRDTEGRVEMVLGSYLDITDRKQAEAEIRNSRKRLAQIIDSLPDPTFVINMAGVVTAWNRAVVELTGVRAKDMMGKGNHEYALPFYGKRRPVLIDLVLNWDGSWKKKYILLHKKEDGFLVAESYHPCIDDGRYLSSTARVLFDAEGNPSGAIESIRDISETRRTQEALRESQERIKTILDSVNIGIMVINAENQIIVEVNPLAESMIGSPKKDIIGKSCRQIICMREGEGCPILDDGQPMDNAEHLLVAADGRRIPILKTVVPVVLDGKKHLLESFVDITDRKAAEEELQRNLDELERFNRLTINREQRMIELKEEINQLHAMLGENPRYKIVE